MKLGRKAVVRDSRTLRLEKYMTALNPPTSRNWGMGIQSWGMLDNDTLGDCTCAAVGHAVQVWTAVEDREALITDAEVLDIYERWCGYNPADPSTDQGGICLDVLTDWKAQGFAGHPIKAFASISPSSTIHIKDAINIFGGVYIGFNVPQFVMPANGQIPPVWNLEPSLDNTIIGGHCVFCYGYTGQDVNFISWGSNYAMSWEFWDKFVDEAYAMLSTSFLNSRGTTPIGLNLAQLETDLTLIP